MAVEGEGVSGRYRDVFSGRTVDVQNRLLLAELFADLPIAVLVRAQ